VKIKKFHDIGLPVLKQYKWGNKSILILIEYLILNSSCTVREVLAVTPCSIELFLYALQFHIS
jgi:hypothetical protein